MPTAHRSTQDSAVLGQNYTLQQAQQSNSVPPQAVATNPHLNAIHTASASQQNVLLPAPPATRDMLHLQGTSPLQCTGMIGGLPLPQQAHEQHIIPTMQALPTTAVNQDLVQRRLAELHREAQPQATGNGACNHYSNEHKCNNSTKKGKKRENCSSLATGLRICRSLEG